MGWRICWGRTRSQKRFGHYGKAVLVGMARSRSEPFAPSSETKGQIVGPKTKIKTGGKKFDEQKYERKIRAPGDKLFTHQFSAQSGASIRSAVWNWCVKSLSPGARIFLSYFCSSNFFPPVLIFVFGPTICPWVSEDAFAPTLADELTAIKVIHSLQMDKGGSF